MFQSFGILASRKRTKRKRFFFRFFILSFLTIAVVFSAVFFFFRWEKFRITEVKINGFKTLSESDVRNEVKSLLSEKVLEVLPASNFFLFSGKKVQDELLSKFPRASEVSVQKDYPSSLEINIKEREPVALLCSQGGKECFFIDETGYAFEKAPVFSAGVFLKFFDERTAESPSAGKIFLNKDELKKMSEFAKRISSSFFLVCEVRIKNDGVCEFLGKSGIKVIINKGDDFELVFANLEMAFSEILEKEGKTIKDAEYIDLRFGNKVFFKWK